MISDKSLSFGFRGLRWLGKPYCSEDCLSWWQAICAIVVITIITTISIVVSFEERLKHERISTFISLLSIVGNNFLASNLILLNLRRKHPLGPIMKTLHSLPFSLPASNHISWMFYGFALVLLNLLIDFLVFPMFKIVKLFPVFYLSDVLIYLFLAQFVIPLLMIKDRLSNISLSLQCLGRREPSELMSQIDEILWAHMELINLCFKLKQIFSWPLLVIVGAKLFGATASTYHSACVYFNLFKDRNSVIESYSGMIGTANEIYVIWCIIHSAWLVTEKVRQANGDIYTLCISDDSRTLIQNERVTSFLEQRLSLKFTAHGLFGLDHYLFRSILATISSYLFIIIQFQIRSNIEEKKALHRKNRHHT